MTNIIYIIAGVLMILLPGHISDIICYLIAGVILSFAFNQVIKFTKEKKNYILVIGILAAMLGFYILFNPKSFASLIPTVVGVLITVDSISKLLGFLDLNKAGVEFNKVVLITTFLLLGLGLFLIFNPFGAIELIIVLIGVILIANGVLGIVTTKETNNIIEAEIIKKKK